MAATLRYTVEQAHLGVRALESELEEALAAAKPQLSDEDFLKLVSRALNLKKQALVACLQAVQRAQNTVV